MKKVGLIIFLLLAGFVKVKAGCANGVYQTPIVDSISVDIAGNVTICWQPVMDPDVIKYYIFDINSITSTFDLIDSVPAGGGGPYCYTSPAGKNNSDFEPVNLTVITGYTCIDPVTGLPFEISSSIGQFHRTMYLDQTPDPCSGSISLLWTTYEYFVSGSNIQYDIYVSENAGPYTIAGNVSSPDTSFNYLGIKQGSNYDFYVRAIENNGAGPNASSSNDINVNGIDFLKKPNPTYLYSATVIDSLQIDLSFFIDTLADIDRYEIKRAVSADGPYNTVGTIASFTGMPVWQQFSDNSDINANSTFYFYRVEAIDICGNSTDTSNIGRTVLLKVKSDGINATNTLTITQYDGWLGNVDSYDIYRSVAGVWESTAFASISPFSEEVTYVDDITSVFYGDGQYCYKIIANEANVVHPGLATLPATSISNEACVTHEPLIYVPNTFIPSGNSNVEFKPVLTFSDPNNYLFQIFNKWGQKIFETEDVGEAWNGRVNNTGNMSQTDSYVYVIRFVSASSEEYAKRGLINLLR